METRAFGFGGMAAGAALLLCGVATAQPTDTQESTPASLRGCHEDAPPVQCYNAALAEITILRQRLEEMGARLEQISRNQSMVYWVPRDIRIPVNFKEVPSNAPISFVVPRPKSDNDTNSIPDYAREILVSAYIATGLHNTPAGRRSFEISTRYAERSTAFRLVIHGLNSPAWAYTTQNFWLPLGLDRNLYIRRISGPSLPGDVQSEVRIIGFR